ncbi:hypothetical protein EDD22DRAFT_851929 [Suillus occidentalis]|nr:hypothetical protein EDD22DRAFT_851929 [Suillus occidentalis]
MASHPAPSILMPTVQPSALDTEDLLGTETLIPPIASIQDTDFNSNATLATPSLLDDTHASSAVHSSRNSFVNASSSDGSIGTYASFTNRPVQDIEHTPHTNSLSSFTPIQDHTLLSNGTLTNALPSLSSILDRAHSSNATSVNPLVRHETLLSPARDTLIPDGTRSLSCDKDRPLNKLSLSNESILCEVDETDQTLDKPQHVNNYRVQVQSPPSSIASTPPPSTDSHLDAPNNSSSVDVFFLQSSTADEPHTSHDAKPFALHSAFPPTPPNSKASFFFDEEMPSLTPSRPYVPPTVKAPPDEPKLESANSDNLEGDIPMLTPSESPDVTFGTLPYHGFSRADGRTTIAFEGLTRSQAQHYLLTSPLAQYNDYHSVYFPNVICAIESYCFCQDHIISFDWDMDSYRDGTYSGHPVIPGHVKLPTGGPRSQRTWQERVPELRDHRAHTRHLIHLLDTILSTRMLAESSQRAPVVKCDHYLTIQGGLTKRVYAGRYDNVNPFFTESEAKCLNSYVAVAEAHGESQFASKILDALLMPFPDEDTVNALTETRLLDVGSTRDILRLAFDRDLILGIARTGLVIVATSPFQSEMFEDPSMPNEWRVLSDIAEEDEEMPKPKSKKKKFFL